MGEKKKNNNNSNQGGEKKKKGGDGGEKKEDNPITVVLKIDMHCEGCASKIVKCVKGFDGVHTVKPDSGASKLTVVGKVDPTSLRDKLADKTKKKVDLVSPQPKKDKENKDGGGNDSKKEKDGGNENKKADDDNKKKKAEKPNDDKKPKEPPVTTAVLKLSLHCQGCVEKIRKAITKTKGYHEMELDRQKELVTVKGTMDMKALAETLKEKLKRPVEIVPPKKEKEKDKEKDKEGGENGGGNGENGGGKKKKNKGDGGGDGGGGGGEKMEGHIMEYEYHPVQAGYGQAPYVYGSGYGYPAPPPPVYIGDPQMFSDENPNACSVM